MADLADSLDSMTKNAHQMSRVLFNRYAVCKTIVISIFSPSDTAGYHYCKSVRTCLIDR